MAALLLIGACSLTTARSPAHPASCASDYSAPIADSVLAFVSGTVAAVAPAVPPVLVGDHGGRRVAEVALVSTAIFTASTVYGFAVVDPDGCERARKR